MRIELFIEGKHDELFFTKLFEVWNYGIPKITRMGGYSEINVVADFILDNNKNGVKSIVIIDCDIDYVEREKQFINTIPQSLYIDNSPMFQYFIIDADSTIKNLEDLLLKIAVHQEIVECINTYKNCIAKDSDYRIPTTKSSINYYHEVLSDIKKMKGIKSNDKYHNEVWNFNHDALKPFQLFLKSIISQI